MASRWTVCGLGHPLLLLLLLLMVVVIDMCDLLVVPEVGLARRHVVALPAHHALVPSADDVAAAAADSRPAVKDSSINSARSFASTICASVKQPQRNAGPVGWC